MNLSFFFLFFLGSCWGSFLNCTAFRLLHEKSIFKARSSCPYCHKTIYWYDLIPVVSWILLRGRCRFCATSLSLLYPFIEIITGTLTVGLAQSCAHLPTETFFAYYFFFSLLIIALRTDLEAFVIPEIIIIFGIPVGLLCAWAGLIPIFFLDAVLGLLLGVLFFGLVSYGYFLLRKTVGLGMGDIELIALIGSFTGIFGTWTTILISSLVGTITTLLYCLVTGKRYNIRVPFGPFLALGAFIFVIFRTQILLYFF